MWQNRPVLYEYDTKNIHENDIFRTFKNLFEAVTGRVPPTGKKNLDIAKANLKQYLDYAPLCEADSSCTSKRAVIVTKIYQPPLPKEYDDRGKNGRYADLLKLLLLSRRSFEGKYTTLENTLGLFGKYLDEVKSRNPEIAIQLERQDDCLDFNLWKHSKHTPAGEREYKSIISLKLREILKGALQSLPKEEVVSFQDIYKIVPDREIVMEDFTLRPRSMIEEYEEYLSFNRYSLRCRHCLRQ